MKKRFKSACCLLLLSVLASCATYSMPVTATDQPIGKRTGEASGVTYFWWFGDASRANIMDAACNAGINRISTVDMKVNNFMNFIQTYTVIVTGE